jgi:hypothetical protein
MPGLEGIVSHLDAAVLAIFKQPAEKCLRYPRTGKTKRL